MKYHELGKSGIIVSRLALGTWGLGGGSVWTDGDSDVEAATRLLEFAKAQGVNYIDTAPVYGTGVSEELLGAALKSAGLRKDFVLQTKCSLNWRGDGGNFHYERDGYTVNNDTSKAAVKRDVEDSLKRLQTDYIDSIIVHYVCKTWPVEETVEGLEELRKEGKIRAYGLSNSQPADLEAYQEAGEKYKTGGETVLANGLKSLPCGTSLVQEFFSLLSPFHGRDYFPVCSRYGTTFQVYGVLEEGFLTGPDFLNKEFKKTDIRSRIPWVAEDKKEGLLRYYKAMEPLCVKYGCSYAQLALAWALAQYDNMSLLVGARKTAKLEDSVKALELKLDAADIAFMEETVKDIQEEVLDK